MEKFSHKELIKEGKRLNGFQWCGNVYSYENALYNVMLLKRFNGSMPYDWQLYGNIIIDYIYKHYHNIESVNVEQVGYSCGINGNTGQLHKIYIFGAQNKLLDILYMYY